MEETELQKYLIEKEEFLKLIKNIMKKKEYKEFNLSKIKKHVMENVHLTKSKIEFIETKYKKELEKFNINFDSVEVTVLIDYNMSY